MTQLGPGRTCVRRARRVSIPETPEDASSPDPPALPSAASVQTLPSITDKSSAVLILSIKQRHAAICQGSAARQALTQLLVFPDINRNTELKLPVARVCSLTAAAHVGPVISSLIRKFCIYRPQDQLAIELNLLLGLHEYNYSTSCCHCNNLAAPRGAEPHQSGRFYHINASSPPDIEPLPTGRR